jgi:hypothetical protein
MSRRVRACAHLDPGPPDTEWLNCNAATVSSLSSLPFPPLRLHHRHATSSAAESRPGKIFVKNRKITKRRHTHRPHLRESRRGAARSLVPAGTVDVGSYQIRRCSRQAEAQFSPQYETCRATLGGLRSSRTRWPPRCSLGRV